MTIFDRFNIKVIAVGAGLCGAAIAFSPDTAAAPLKTGGACIEGQAGEVAGGRQPPVGRRVPAALPPRALPPRPTRWPGRRPAHRHVRCPAGCARAAGAGAGRRPVDCARASRAGGRSRADRCPRCRWALPCRSVPPCAGGRSRADRCPRAGGRSLCRSVPPCRWALPCRSALRCRWVLLCWPGGPAGAPLPGLALRSSTWPVATVARATRPVRRRPARRCPASRFGPVRRAEAEPLRPQRVSGPGSYPTRGPLHRSSGCVSPKKRQPGSRRPHGPAAIPARLPGRQC